MITRVKSLFSFTNKNKCYDLKSIFMPIYMPLSLMGILPYSISFNLRGCKIIKKSIYFSTVRAVTINLIILALNLLHLQHIVANTESSNFTSAITAEINYILEIFILYLAVLAIYIWTYINCSKYIKVLNVLASSWNELPRCGNRVLWKLYVKIYFCIAVIIIILIAMILVNFSRSESFWKIILSAVSFILPTLIQYTVITFYCCLAMMVEASLVIINENCLTIIKDRRTPMGYFMKVENRSATFPLRHLELVYVKVIESKREINAAFEAPILLTLLQSFHAMVSEAYIMYRGVVVKKTFTLHETFNCSLWVFYQALKVFALSFTGNKLKCEAIKIGRNLYNIPVNKMDQRMYMEIQHFSSLIGYQSADLSVYGFFTIDGTLLFNVMASAAMYVIILLQFDKKD